MKEIAQWQFETDVLDAPLPVLVDFYAPWCGPCRMLTPVLESVAGEYTGRVNVLKVNVDEAPDLAGRYQISSVPTLMLFHRGRVVGSLVGLPSVRSLRSLLDPVADISKSTAALGHH